MTTVVLLAAGASRRFGADCKLQALYRGKPLVRYAADAILETGLPAVAVTADPAVEHLLPEFRIVRSIGSQAESLRAGLSQVHDDRALVVLGDMPHVDGELLLRLAATPAPAAASDGNRITPPASIPRSLFADIALLSGDQGAGAVLRSRPDLHLISVDSLTLQDIDRPEDITGISKT
ncbi:NTP transferase domain-containing protein [uncultured Paracoccus sp.]|uniref:nucleotidyltransferase family protein n=1 Tax=uncultured Paracoccus sp. TaxID=189685 RepID=UPI0025E82778|nr:NTP transferase domain-containing protein [uncultured Paracoccus sp.]